MLVWAGFLLDFIHPATRQQPGPAGARPQVTKQAPSKEPAGELGEGILSPEYAELERQYSHEARDGDWAASHEQRIVALLEQQALRSHVALIHCQQTVCRIVLETEARDAFAQLLQVPGMSAATGLSARSPYSLRAGQLSVYFQAEPVSGR
jgi:hypothetical protein